MEQEDSLLNELVKKTRDDLNVFEKRSPRFSMIIKAMVWNRKSHGLFDYESDSVTRSQLGFKQSGMLVRENDKINFISNNDSYGEIEDDEEDPKLLSYIRQKSDNEYVIEPRNDATSLNNRIWLIIRSLNSDEAKVSYAIKPNQVIKLGRVILRVIEINTDFHQAESGHDEEFDDIIHLKDEPLNEDAGRFGWSSDETEDNPKIGPCICTGSMRYIHYMGLKQWIDSRRNLKNGPGVYSIIWKNFDGEICKTQYPYTFHYRKRRWNLHSPYLPEDKSVKYIVLESMKNDRNAGRMVHTLTATDEKSEYKLGRGHESDVRVNDISVSRLHMQIKYKNGLFVMEDGKSKFGTLVLIQNELEIKAEQNRAIQVGRTMINLSVKEYNSQCQKEEFGDKTASKFFDRKKDEFLPRFGKEVVISENIDDLPNVDHIQNIVPHFGVHPNNSVIKGKKLPNNEYYRNQHANRPNPF